MRLSRVLVTSLVAVSLVSGSGACGDDDDDNGGGSSSAAGAVTINDFTFEPDPIRVRSGTTVTWTNDDTAAHQVLANDDSYESERLEPGGSTYEHVFDRAGTYEYHCGIHASMTGTVEVS